MRYLDLLLLLKCIDDEHRSTYSVMLIHESHYYTSSAKKL